MLPRHARYVLSRLRCNGHSLLLSSLFLELAQSRILPASACGHPSQYTSYLILHCPATDFAPLALWRVSVSLRPLVQALGSSPASEAPWSFAMPSSFGRGHVTRRRPYGHFAVSRTLGFSCGRQVPINSDHLESDVTIKHTVYFSLIYYVTCEMFDV